MPWHQQPFVQGSYSSYLVGQYTTIAGKEGHAAGRLHFCGEHTSPEFQAYMEGGAHSGTRAAKEVCVDLKLAFRTPPHSAEANAGPDAGE